MDGGGGVIGIQIIRRSIVRGNINSEDDNTNNNQRISNNNTWELE